MVAPAGRLQVEDIASRAVQPTIIPDPGDAGTIDVTRSGICEITATDGWEWQEIAEDTGSATS